MRGVDAQDAGQLGQRSRQVQLVTGPGNMAVTEIFQVVVDTRGQGHPGAARGHDLVVLGGPELAHIQAVVGQAPVDRHDELAGPVAEQASEQLRHGSALRLAAGSGLEVVQSGKLTVGRHEQTQHDEQHQAAAAHGRHADPAAAQPDFPTGAQV